MMLSRTKSRQIEKEVQMPRKNKGPRARGVIDSELAEVEAERRRLDVERNRLLAARAGLEGRSLPPTPTSPPRGVIRITREMVTDHLREHPGSTSRQVADDMGAKFTTVAKHLSRGHKDGIYRYQSGCWSVIEE
jgi:hypothetical protein